MRGIYVDRTESVPVFFNGLLSSFTIKIRHQLLRDLTILPLADWPCVKENKIKDINVK